MFPMTPPATRLADGVWADLEGLNSVVSAQDAEPISDDFVGYLMTPYHNGHR